MDILQQGADRPNLQFEIEEEWFEVQETSERTRLLEDC